MIVDQLIFVGLNGYAVALDRDTGRVVWSNDELRFGYTTLLLDGDRLIVSTAGYLFCLDPRTGKSLWNNPMRGYGDFAPAALVSVRGGSQQTPVQAPARGRKSGNTGPTIDRLTFVGLNGYAVALDRETGEIVWSNDELRSGYTTLLLDGDRLIVSTGGYLFCLDPLTGKVLWNNPMKGYGASAPTALVSVRGQSQQTVTQAAAAIEAAT